VRITDPKMIALMNGKTKESSEKKLTSNANGAKEIVTKK